MTDLQDSKQLSRLTITFVLSLVTMTIGFIVRLSAHSFAVNGYKFDSQKHQFYAELGWAICLLGAMLLSVSISRWIGESRSSQ